MRLKLEHRWTEMLRKLPESGMGYQRVDVRFADGRELKGALVFNGQQLEAPVEFEQTEISELKLTQTGAGRMPTAKTRLCPKCQTPMKLDKRAFPQRENAAFMGEDLWKCPNPKCKHQEAAD